MLPRQNRLLATERLIHPKTIHSVSFILRTAASPTKSSRVGIIISKKVDKRAVKRNRLRRVIASGLQAFLPTIQSPTDLLFILKAKSVESDEQMLVQEVIQVLKKEKIL